MKVVGSANTPQQSGGMLGGLGMIVGVSPFTDLLNEFGVLWSRRKTGMTVDDLPMLSFVKFFWEKRFGEWQNLADRVKQEQQAYERAPIEERGGLPRVVWVEGVKFWLGAAGEFRKSLDTFLRRSESLPATIQLNEAPDITQASGGGGEGDIKINEISVLAPTGQPNEFTVQSDGLVVGGTARPKGNIIILKTGESITLSTNGVTSVGRITLQNGFWTYAPEAGAGVAVVQPQPNQAQSIGKRIVLVAKALANGFDAQSIAALTGENTVIHQRQNTQSRVVLTDRLLIASINEDRLYTGDAHKGFIFEKRNGIWLFEGMLDMSSLAYQLLDTVNNIPLWVNRNKPLINYEIVEQLYRNAWKGNDLNTKQTFVIKKVEGDDNNVTLMQRAVDEYERLRRFNQAKISGIPRVYGIVDSPDDDHSPSVVTEFIDGPNLGNVIRERTLTHDKILSILRDLASTLDQIHSVGEFHYDIKPENIVVGSKRAILIDFEVGDTPETMGTPGYIAPELNQGKPFTKSSDLYSLAAITYDMLTNSDPEELPVSHSSLNSEIQQVFMKALNDDPTQRYGSGIEFYNALQQILQQDQTIAQLFTEPVADAMDAAAKKLEDCPEASLPTSPVVTDNAASSSLGGSGFIADIPEKKRNNARKGDDLDVSVDQNIFKGHDLFLSRLTIPSNEFEVQNRHDAQEHAHGKAGIDDVAHELAIDHMVLREESSARTKNSIPAMTAFATSSTVPTIVSRTSELGDMSSTPNHPAARFVKTSANIVGRINENDFTDAYHTTLQTHMSNFFLIPRAYAAEGQVLAAGTGCGVPGPLRPMIPAVINGLHGAADFTRTDFPRAPNTVIVEQLGSSAMYLLGLKNQSSLEGFGGTSNVPAAFDRGGGGEGAAVVQPN